MLESTNHQSTDGSTGPTERALRCLLESLPNSASWMLDPAGRVTSWGPAAERLLGYRPEEILGQPFACFFPTEEGIANRPQRALELAARRERFEEEGLRVRHDGSTFLAHIVVAAVRGANGGIEGFAVLARDMGARLPSDGWLGEAMRQESGETEAELAGQGLRSLAILDSMPTPLVLIDPVTLRICFANRAADEFAGGHFPRAPATEADCCRRFLCADAEGNPIPEGGMPGARAARGENLRGFQMSCHTPDGATRSLLVSSQLLPAGDGYPAIALVCFDDVTELKRAQSALEQTIRMRDDFLSIAGHELRTPLTALQLQMQSLGRLLLRHEGTGMERAARKMEAASRQIERLSVLVAQLLEVSRINSGRLTLESQPVDLAALVRDVAARFEEEAERVECRLVVSADGRWVGQWDRERLDQVLSNLISNAIKYGRGQPVEVTLEGDERHARLQVRDRGIGIAPEDQARIFDRFERAVSDRHYGGLGLGLWITREIVRAMGGTIGVESAPEQGALFTVELPVPAPQ